MSDLLNEQGLLEVESVMQYFRDKLHKVASEVLSNLYTDIHDYIETDAWANYRESIRQAMRGDIVKDTLTNEFAKAVRDQIFSEHKDELVSALNQDLVRENSQLAERIKYIREVRGE